MSIQSIKCISNSKGIPSSSMTNEQWRECFNIMKRSIKQSKYRRMPVCSAPTVINHYITGCSPEYCGETQWTNYRRYINNVLSAIRKGEHDYCYFTYQIEDLLRYEHDNLRTQWLPEYGCFRVWLSS